jgi:[ribosomal protein S5]-alanine N-acetyltransferase
MTTPSIHTDRLLLRPFHKTDAPDVFAYACNPNVSRYTTWTPHETLADSEAFIDMVLRRGPNEHTWAICLGSEPSVVGAIEFGMNGGQDAQLDYVLAEPLWNQGLMTEAASAVIAWGLSNYPAVQRIRSCAVTQNVGSQRVMEKCGLRFEGTRLHQWAKCAQPVEQRHYVFTREI